MTHRLADSLVCYNDKSMVYLDDSFLQKYEQTDYYDCVPCHYGNSWCCNPKYKGQWGFSECRRVGRNLIHVPIREIYKGIPDQEILHAHNFVIEPSKLSEIDLHEEHIAGKVERFIDVLLQIGDSLSSLGNSVGLQKSPVEWVKIDRTELQNNGWGAYSPICRLSQVVPLGMSQQDFLARCKILHEIIANSIPSGHLKSLLKKAGCINSSLKDCKNLKLIQMLLNIIEPLNAQFENIEAFVSDNEPEGFQNQNKSMAMLFLNNDLRNADAHPKDRAWMTTLQNLGFETANLNTGYGKAFDFVFDGVIESLNIVASQIEILLSTRRRNRR